MYYQISDCVKQISRSEINSQYLTAGFITLTELKKYSDSFGFAPATVAACEEENKYFRSSISVYENYSFATVKITPFHKGVEAEDCIAFYISNNFFLVVDIIDSDGSTKNNFLSALQRYPQSGFTLEKLVFAFLDTLVLGDSHILEDMDFDISKLENAILKGKTTQDFPIIMAHYKKKVLLFRNYYEQLIDISEELVENENDIFAQKELRYLKMFNDKVNRLCNNVLLLREELSQARDAHQSLLDSKMNNVMKFLTVLSTIFLPLTLITSWYGMNFVHMPELQWEYSYLGVFVLCVAVAVICIGIFKKKNWF